MTDRNYAAALRRIAFDKAAQRRAVAEAEATAHPVIRQELARLRRKDGFLLAGV